MSLEDRCCNYCAKPCKRDFGCFGAYACEGECDTALSWLLDGVNYNEVLETFP
jgi:hypothetical protein